jgi:hypothetical protein
MKIIIPEYKLRALLKVPYRSSLEPFWVCTMTRGGEMRIVGLTKYFDGNCRGKRVSRKRGDLFAQGKEALLLR